MVRFESMEFIIITLLLISLVLLGISTLLTLKTLKDVKIDLKLPNFNFIPKPQETYFNAQPTKETVEIKNFDEL